MEMEQSKSASCGVCPISIILRRHHTVLYAFILVVIPLIIRIIMFPHTKPCIFPDSVEYIQLSESLNRFEFAPFYRRTPGYPLFLSVIFLFFGKQNFNAVVAVQMVLSSCVPLLIFLLFIRLARRQVYAFLASLAVAFDIFLAGNDTMILTESLAMFLLVLAVLLFITALRRQSIVPALGSSLLFVYLGLTRPLFSAFFLILGIITLIWLIYNRPQRIFSKDIRVLSVFLGVSFLITVSWCIRNAIAYRTFGISTSLGCSITNLTGDFLEEAQARIPDEFIVKGVYLEKREKDKTHIMTIWKILPELEMKYGLSEPQVSKIALRLSKRAILKRPAWYLINVTHSWCTFWAGRIVQYYSPEAMKAVLRVPCTKTLWYLYEHVIFGNRFIMKYLPVIFILSCVILIMVKRRNPEGLLIVLVVGATVFYTAILSSLLEMGENPRYRIPVEPYIIGLIVLAICEGAEAVILKISPPKDLQSPDMTGQELCDKSDDSLPGV